MYLRTRAIGQYHYTEAVENHAAPHHRIAARWPARLTLDQAIAIAIAQVRPDRLKALREVQARLIGPDTPLPVALAPASVPPRPENKLSANPPPPPAAAVSPAWRNPAPAQAPPPAATINPINPAPPNPATRLRPQSARARDLCARVLELGQAGPVAERDLALATGADKLQLLSVLVDLQDAKLLWFDDHDRVCLTPDALARFHRLVNAA